MAHQHLTLLYADPGSGALIWQLIVAAVLGGAFYLRRFKERLFSFRKKDTGADALTPPDAAGNDT